MLIMLSKYFALTLVVVDFNADDVPLEHIRVLKNMSFLFAAFSTCGSQVFLKIIICQFSCNLLVFINTLE